MVTITRNILILLFCSSCSLTDLKIINTPAYSIGIVDVYTPPSNAHVTFYYEVRGKPEVTSYGDGFHHWNVPSSGVHVGDKYMVQYDSLDLSTARMLFSYPVKDSTDYKKYVTLFKTKPPGYPSP